jgi:hypothetical protein
MSNMRSHSSHQTTVSDFTFRLISVLVFFAAFIQALMGTRMDFQLKCSPVFLSQSGHSVQEVTGYRVSVDSKNMTRLHEALIHSPGTG